MGSDVFRKFCYYVDEHIFSKESLGSYVALVVDQSFVDDFCKENHTTEETLMCSARKTLWTCHRDHLAIKGIIAIQLFAATKRANKDGLTVGNYRDRLSQVLNWDINDLQQWMVAYQEDVWLSLYQWCDNNYFQITKCKPRTGKGRYVQFPVNQALRVFTEEDFLYIAKVFVDNDLYPGEDITQVEFWKIIKRESLFYYFETRHAKEVMGNSTSEEDYLSQIYNFYLRWNGKYKLREKVIRTDLLINSICVYLTEDLASLELRDENLKLLREFSLIGIKYSDIQLSFHFKRKGFLLFKKDDMYDDRWQEVRYIDAAKCDYSEESEMYGIAVCFKNEISFSLEYKMKGCEILLESRYIIVYKVKRHSLTEEFFTEKRTYELYGGFKVGKNAYLQGALPVLRLLKPSMVWIDGKVVGEGIINGDYSLNNLTLGCHYIKLPNIKRIMIDVVKISVNVLGWQDIYNKWKIEKVPAIWQNQKLDQGIVGLDFSIISDSDTTIDESVVRRWAKAFVLGQFHDNENNVAINLIKKYNGDI